MSRIFKRQGIREKLRRLIAYDLETTAIAKGTPTPLYITAYGEDFDISAELGDLESLAQILVDEFLVSEQIGTYFVAWNANHFDVYFIGLSLLRYTSRVNQRYLIRPFLTKNGALRGMCIEDAHDKDRRWFFLDGMAMTGAGGIKLEKFVETFAPNYPKLKTIDFEAGEKFNSKNPEHIRYAERDSEALFHAISNCDSTIRSIVNHGLTATIGNLGIKFFRSQIPKGVLIKTVPEELEWPLRNIAFRGGYCWVQRRYTGPVWKYDINQAYAAAMRDARLPCGTGGWTNHYHDDKAGIYHVFISRSMPSLIPFYYKSIEKHPIGLFTTGDHPVETWITSDEVAQLKSEHWLVEIIRGYVWQSHFNMNEMVGKLEALRLSDPAGPSGPLGTVCKYLGNNSYGKTVERLGGFELVMCAERPEGEGWHYYDAENPFMDFVWTRRGDRDRLDKDYHKPQLGTFITSHNRMVLRRAALGDSAAFLYADTDCATFSRPVKHIEIHPGHYGKWKLEVSGDIYIIQGKKVYCSLDGNVKHAKGLHTKKLLVADFERWHRSPPVQEQLQRQSFVKVAGGADMFKPLEHGRTGTNFNKLSTVSLSPDGKYIPKKVTKKR